MPLSFLYDAKARVLIISVRENLCESEIEEMFRDICANPAIPNDSDAIWDMNDYLFDQATRRSFQVLINGRAQFPGPSQARIVLVAESDLGFGMCRMYKSMCDLSVSIADNATHVSRTQNEAMAWLKAE